MNSKFFILMAVGALLAVSCSKVTTECSYVLQPFIERSVISEGTDGISVKEQEVTAGEAVVAHLFLADTSNYEVASYADAEAGVMRSRSGGSSISPSQTAQQDADGNITLGPARSGKAVLVICYTADPEKIYAWREVDVPENLLLITLPMTARPYTEDGYTDAKWAFTNEEPSEEPAIPTTDEEDETGDESEEE